MKKYLSSPIAVLVIAVTLASAAYSFYYHDRPRVDADAYDKIGWNLARGLGYIEDETNAGNPRADDAIVRVGPGYQFFLAGVYTLFGHHIWIVWILHAVLRGATAYLIYILALMLFSQGSLSAWRGRIALVSAGLFGFSPDLIVINGLLLTETLFIFLLVAAVYTTLKLFRGERYGMLCAGGSGLLWALAILTRPVALLPVVFLVIILLYQRRFHAGFAVLLVPLFLVGSWSYAMTARYDHFILTTTAGWYDIWVGNNPEATGGFEKSAAIQEFRDVTHDSTILDRVGKEKYAEFITTQPFSFLELQWRKTALYFSLVRPGGYWIHLFSRPWHMLATLGSSAVWTFVLFAAGLSGAYIFMKQRKDLPARVTALFAALQPLAVIPIIVETRYRYALFPFLSIFAAYWIYTYMKSEPQAFLRPYARNVLVGVVLLLIVFTGYDFWYNFGDIMEKAQRIL